MSSILSIDGQRSVLPQVGAKALTRLGSTEAGRSIVLDEYAVAHLGRQGAALGRASGGFQQSPRLIDALVSYPKLNRPEAVAGTRSGDIHPYSGAEAKFTLGDATALVIQHQREHPANHNFTPVPHVTFEPRPYADPAAQGQRGFAVVDFGESGYVLNVEILTGHGMTPPELLASAISDGLRTQFKDHRRHDHRAYLAYRIDAGVVQVAGEPVVTLPMCCPGPPGPGEQCGQVHCEEN